LAFAVLVVAGLASLATEPGPPQVHGDLMGSTIVPAEGASVQIEARFSRYVPPTGEYGQSNVMTFDIRGASGQAHAAFESPLPAPVSGSPAEASKLLSLTNCATQCVVTETIDIRLADPAAAPAKVAWAFHLTAAGSGNVALSVVGQEDPESVYAPIAIGASVGAAMGLLTVVVLWLPWWRRSRLVALEVVTAAALSLAGAYVALGFFVSLATASAGLALIAVAVCVVIGGLVTRSWPAKPSLWLAAIVVAVVPFVFARLVTAGVYRDADVVVAMAGSGFALVAAAVELAVLLRGALSGIERTSHVAAVGVAAAVALAISAILGFLSIRADDPSGALIAVPFATIAFAVATGAWRWLHGDALSGFMASLIALIVSGLALLGLFLSTLSLFGEHRDQNPLFAAAALAVATLFLTFLCAIPPRLAASHTVGRAFQTGWQWRDDPRS
jgi:hypothetical protein